MKTPFIPTAPKVGSRVHKLRRHAFLLAACLGVCSLESARAVPACPEPIEVTQPDGTKVQVHLRGDEFFHWHETPEGYAIVKDPADGFWKLARPAAGQAEFRAIPGAKADSANPAAYGLTRHALPDAAVLRAHVQARRQALEGTPTALAAPQPGTSGTSGTQSSGAPAGIHPNISVSGVKTITNIVILACFSNHWDYVNNTVLPAYGRVDTNEYYNLYNQVGYNTDGASGSVKDYYREVSYGKLTIQSVITKWVRLPRESSYYGAGTQTGIPKVMVADAIAAAAAAGFDFSQGDSDGDGWVDALDVLHSGYGEEATGNPDDVWSVKGTLSGVVTNNGVRMYNYHEEPALRGSSGTGIERIGTICHETGHFFGLPDLYDYSSLSSGLGNWCIMAGGSWNGSSGTSPAHHSAWSKVFLGFAKPVQIHALARLSLPHVEDNPVVGMLRDGTTNGEYFLVENRANLGFDNTTQIYPGMLIYHVDRLSANNDLGTWPHPEVKLEEADGDNSIGSKATSSEAGDAWTSTSGLASGWCDQTGNTNTSAMLYQNGAYYTRTDNPASYSYNRLANFSAAGSPMTCDATTLKPTAPTQSALPLGFTVSWHPASQATKYEIQEGAPVTLTSFSDGADSEDAMYANWYVSGNVQRVSTNGHSNASCYMFNGIQSLTLQKPFTATASTVLSFYVMSHVTAGNGFFKCDISNDGGNTWHTLGTYNGYIDPWSARSYNYTALSAAGINNGDQCIIRFLCDIEYGLGWSSFPAYGFAVDDISLTGTAIAGYGNWTSLNNNVAGTSYPIAAKPVGAYAYRIQAYANGAWQGFGPEGQTTVRANQAPVWTANPMSGAEANVGVAYSGDLSLLVTDEVNDTVSFGKVSGPAWLTVNANGTLVGTPQAGDAGLNTFTVRATDLAGAYADATLTVFVKTPLAAWHMNELAGPTVHDSVGGFNGTAWGSLQFGQPGVPGATAGNSAITFSGSGTWVTVPALNIANNTVTITALLKCNGTQPYLAGIVAPPEFTFGFGNNNNQLAYVRGGFIYSASGLVVPNNQWTFVALVISPGANAVLHMATNATLYSYTTSRSDPASTIFNGTTYFADSDWASFSGSIDDVAIYGTALSAAQLSQLASAALAPAPVVTLTSPADGSGFAKPASFTLAASIVPNSHSIGKAQFYNGPTWLGEASTSPYSISVTNLDRGTYTFSAKAVYDGANVVGSLPITVHVTNSTQFAGGQITAVLHPSGNAVLLNCTAVATYTYQVQRSTNLANPLSWTTLWTTNAPSNGLFQYTDSFNGMTPPPAAYYRLNETAP